MDLGERSVSNSNDDLNTAHNRGVDSNWKGLCCVCRTNVGNWEIPEAAIVDW